MNLEAFVISLVHLLTPTLQSTPATLLLFLRVCVSFHKLMVPHCPPLTSSQLPEPGCCLSARSHSSHSGSASRWRCAVPGTRTGPWDTCLEGWRKQKTKCTLWKGENSLTWKALTVRASETTCAEGISCLTARPVTLLRFRAGTQLCNVYTGASDSVWTRFNVGRTGNWRGGRFLPANTMGLAGLNPGRASTGWSWR